MGDHPVERAALEEGERLVQVMLNDRQAALTDEGSQFAVYRGDGETTYSSGAGGAKNLGNLYSSTYWTEHSCIAADNTNNDDSVVTAFIHPFEAIQVWMGNGTSGLVSNFKFYDWSAP